jgi:F0F1-type ATP synthase delta subunit
MSKVQIKSIFEQIASEVFNMKDVNKAKQFITEFVNNKKIKDEDKKIIIDNVNKCKYLYQIQSYICNSLLRYEGMSLNK